MLLLLLDVELVVGCWLLVFECLLYHVWLLDVTCYLLVVRSSVCWLVGLLVGWLVVRICVGLSCLSLLL